MCEVCHDEHYLAGVKYRALFDVRLCDVCDGYFHQKAGEKALADGDWKEWAWHVAWKGGKIPVPEVVKRAFVLEGGVPDGSKLSCSLKEKLQQEKEKSSRNTQVVELIDQESTDDWQTVKSRKKSKQKKSSVMI